MCASHFYGSLQPPLHPRNGRRLEILAVCRVSDPGPNKQDIRSNDDQEALHRNCVAANTNLPFTITVLAGSGSGECLERSEYLQLIEMVESDQFDLVLAEGLGRIVWRIHAHLFAELCADHAVRLISLNDHVDTAQDGWQHRSIFSAWHHERSNRDTSQRIKRTQRSRFTPGGCMACLPYGYLKKPGAKSDTDVEKLPEAEEVYKEWFRRLDDGALYSEIADWLNDHVVPTGPHCRSEKWNGRIVGRTTHNWILKGLRFRNKRRSKRHNTSGKYITEKADPSELLTRRVPHLAFFDEAYYDRVVAKADARNTKYRRNGDIGPDPCKNRPKKRVRFPGQIIDCGICGRQFVFGGHGQTDHLMCSGAREYKCWNAITVDGPLGTQTISEAVFAQIQSISDFDPAFLQQVNAEANQRDSERDQRLRELVRKIDSTDREISNLLKFLRAGDESPNVRAELQRLERQMVEWQYEKQQIDQTPRDGLVLPCADEIKHAAQEAFKNLAAENYEFGKLLRAVTGRILVWPFRSVDGGDIGLRAKFKLQIANLIPDKRVREVLQKPLEKVIVLDLFEPPQRILYRHQIIELRNTMTEREAAQVVGIRALLHSGPRGWTGSCGSRA